MIGARVQGVYGARIGSLLASERLATPFNLAMGIMLAALLFADAVLSSAVHLSGFSVFFDVWPAMLLLIGCFCYCVLRPLPRLIDSVELIVQAILLNNLLSPLILIAGRSPRPLVDRGLHAIDASMGFSTESIVHLVSRWPAINVVLVLAYTALGPMVIAAILALPFFGFAQAARRYVLGVTFAVVLTAALFALWPAAGPWTTENIKPTQEQAAVTSYLMRLKSNAPAEVDLKDAAIVSFPSFHVALALLTAAALGLFRRLRVWIWILTALICLSTITTGWHYGIDLIGGLLVAVVSLALARRIVREPEDPKKSSL